MAATGERVGAAAEACAVAWAAGIFEGEGCVLVNRSRPGGRCYLALTVAMTDRDVLERFRDVLGIETRVRGVKRRVLRERDRKAVYTLTVSGKAAFVVAELLRPWLGTRRRARLDEVLAEVAKNPPLKYRHPTDRDVALIRELRSEGKSLREVALTVGFSVTTTRRLASS